MRYPPGYLWKYPGIPSMTVSYLRTTDFFFSGHVGLPIIIGCEFYKHNHKLLGHFNMFTCIVEFVVMTIMRGHYIIDLIVGIIIAHYVYVIVDKYVHIIDNSSFSLKNIKDLKNKKPN